MKNNDWEIEIKKDGQDTYEIRIGDKVKGGIFIHDLSKFVNDVIRTQKQLSYKDGRKVELDILESHLNRQIHQNNVETDSIYRYIKSAREAIDSEIKSQDEE